MEDNKWIRELETGDNVIVNFGLYGSKDYQVLTAYENPTKSKEIG